MTLQERMENVRKDHEQAVLKLNGLKDLVLQGEARIHQLQGQYQLLEGMLKDETPAEVV